MQTDRIYFAVPSHYTIGSEHDTYAEAVAAARATITKHDGIPGYSRAFVDVRVNDAQGDRPVHRVEIFRLPDPSACVECGHLHWHGPEHGYSECPIDGCDCKGQSERPTPAPLAALRTHGARAAAAGEVVTEKPTAYVLAQRLAKAIRESEIGKAYGADEGMVVWSAAEHSRFSGHDTTAPAICWEEGPYEWAVGMTGYNGERLGTEHNGPGTDEVTRIAYRAISEAGYYCELTNSFVLAIYPA